MNRMSLIKTLRLLLAVFALLITCHRAKAQPLPAAAQPVQPLQPPHDKAALIQLNGEVDDIMLESIKRRVDIARKAGCTLIIYEVDTYGGLVTSALAIDKFTKSLPADHLATVAWVHDKAYSAGAFISVSCQQIVMSHHATLGDCAPIALSGWSGNVQAMPAAERAKAVSPILEDLDESAVQNGFDKALLHAMVIADIEIHVMRHRVTGENRYVDTAGKDKLLAEEVVAPGGAKDHPWQFVETVDSAAQLLTVSDATAASMSISKATIDTEQDLRAALNIRGELLVLQYSWPELATAWLTQSWVRLILFVGMLVAAWIEFSHPGVTLPGIVAIACLVLLVGAPFLTGLAQAWEILLIILGLAIIVGDLFAFGGVGMLALPGFLLVAIGLIASFVPAEPGGGFLPTMPATWDALQTGLTVVLTGTILAIGSFFILSKYLYITPGFRRLQLAPAAGLINQRPVVRDSADRPAGDAVFIGAAGIAATDLRPAGKVRFDEHLVDVVSFGSFVAKGSEIEVVSVQGNKVVVKPRTGSGPAGELS